jgi:gliding motility-associated-like protein
MSNGIVQVNVSGEIDLNNLLINISNDKGINKTVGENGFQFEALYPGEYTVSVQSFCKDTEEEISGTETVTVLSEYTELLAPLGPDNRSSLNCMHSGMISINISSGKPPYKVEITSKPATYTEETVFSFSSAGNYQFDKLAPGNYEFTISDDCGYTKLQSVTVDKIADDFPSDPYENFSPYGCNQARVWENSSSSHEYWTFYRDFYEIAFTFDTKTEYSSIDSNPQYIDLLEPYSDLYAAQKTAKVYLRLKGTTCEKLVDEIQFTEPAQNGISYTIDKSCFEYTLSFFLNDEAALCPPFQWSISDNAKGELIANPNNLNVFETQNAEGLSFNTDYTLTITDKNGTGIPITFDFSFEQDSPYVGEYRTSERLLLNYNLFYWIYNVPQICLPYKVEIFDENNNLLTTIDNVSEPFDTIRGMEYDKLFIIKISDKDGNVTSFEHYEPRLERFVGEGMLCDDYRLKIERPLNIKDPYTWNVTDKDGKEVSKGTDKGKWISGLLYGNKYTVTFTDGVNTESYTIPENITLPTPTFAGNWTYDVKCRDYGFAFRVQDIVCFPYEWEVFDSDGASVHSEKNLIGLKEAHEVRLEFNKDYRITVTDKKGNNVEMNQRSDKELSGISFDYRSEMSKCVSESYRGYIDIFGQLNADTRIHFVSGPQTPIYTDLTLTDNISDFYPFSEIYTNREDVPITQGDYVFEITDECGEIHLLNISHKSRSEAVGFSYTSFVDDITDVCQGITRIYPRGKIYRDNEPVSTWFTMVEAPFPAPTGMHIHESDLVSYFSLSISGKYVIEIREDMYDCGIDSVVINYEDIAFALDGGSSYVCETGSIGHIQVQAKGGKLPYTYTLFNKDLSPVQGVAPNSNGTFEHGSFGEAYVVQMQDACSTFFSIDVPITTVDQMALLSGKTNFCKGETIELSCLILGATEYAWSGPLEFSANTRKISIPNITAEHGGEYTVRVKPYGCDKFFSKPITITVHEAPEPNISDLYLCVAENEKYNLSATPADANHSIKWYNAYKEPMDAAPIIDLSEVRNYVFHVTQTKDAYSCTSEKKVEVMIGLPPEKNANATGWSCANEYPNIIVTDVVGGYIYTVYSDAEATNQITTFVGTTETMIMTLPVKVSDNTDFYLKTASAGCTLSPSIVEFRVHVDKINILPETLPVYTHGIPYYVKITSDAKEPVFSHTGNAVTGINISPEGIISGTVPESVGREEAQFTVTITDAQTGCKASVEYLMRTCEPMPYLTNNIVEYCEGVRAEPLQAVPIAGNTLQWYDAENNALNEAPVPKTNVAGKQIFFVSQVNATLECEGEKAQVTVVINPAPKIDCSVSAGDICSGSSPSILLEEMNEDFTYSIYSDDNTFLNKLGSLTGTSAGIVDLNETLENNTTYYVLASDLSGCSSLNRKEAPVEVIKLYIEPDKLLPYIKNTDYEQLLVSNAQSPIFTLDNGNLPDGLILNTSGLIYGNVPNYYRDIANIIAVKVQDANGCVAVKEYSFEGNMFVSYIITPNGDGVNDVFMMGHQLIVFDRMGVEMYRGNNGWNGAYKGKPVANDIYFYKLEYTNQQGERKILTGYVGIQN